MKYLSIGTNFIASELFINIKNTQGTKPTGGIWTTQYYENYNHFNEWVDFLCNNPYIIFYHNFDNPYNLPAICITLKDYSKILTIDSLEKVQYLKEKYPFNNWIDYEKISQDYDGIYIHLTKFRETQNEDYKKLAHSYSVNTMLLFNLDCINYYQKGYIDLSQINFEDKYELREYTINIEDKIYSINKPNIEIQALIEIIKEYIIKNNIEVNPESRKIIESIFQETINNALQTRGIPGESSLVLRRVFNEF